MIFSRVQRLLRCRASVSDRMDDSLVWFDGRSVPVRAAMVSIASETALRGANVFEGIRAYSCTENGLGFLALRQHLRRLMTSARLLGIDHPYTVDGFVTAIGSLLAAQAAARTWPDLYVRPSICVVQGRLPTEPEYRVVDYVAVVDQPRTDLYRPATAIVSRWRRPADGPLPPQVKAGGAYLAFRLPVLERARAGVDAVILLNDKGMVAEAEGAAVCIIRDGILSSPPAREGGLRSLTRSIVFDLARDAGIDVRAEPIRHSEIYEADGVFLAGTMCELMPLVVVDGVALDTIDSPLYRRIADGFDRLRREGGPTAGWALEFIATEFGGGDHEA
jgi:branched-chain amino acid aminotransferase